MRQKQSATLRAIDRRIEDVYRQHCTGVQIDIMDIGRVFEAGRRAIAAGADDTALTAAVVGFVESIRKN